MGGKKLVTMKTGSSSNIALSRCFYCLLLLTLNSKQQFTYSTILMKLNILLYQRWVTYKGGVYDITEFMESHPGGVSF